MDAKITRIAIPAAVGIGVMFTERIVIKDAFVHTQLPPESDHEVDLDQFFQITISIAFY